MSLLSFMLSSALCAASGTQPWAIELTAVPRSDELHLEKAAFLSLSSAGSVNDTSSIADSTNSSEIADSEGLEGNSSAVSDLDYVLLANITTRFLLPKQAATWCLGGLVLITGIDVTIKKGFESIPEASILLYCILLGVFCSMVCEIYWEDDARAIIWTELGPYLALSGLFALSMLLVTPLLLLIPDQNFAQKAVKTAGLGGAQKAVASRFQSSCFRRVLLFVYLVLVAFQVSSVYAFYKLAETQEEALAEDQAVQIIKAGDSTSPFTTSVLYLVLAWGSVLVTYEFLFDASFQDDFPRNVLRRIVGADLQAQQPDASGDDASSALLGAMRDASPYATLAGAGNAMAEQGRKLIDSVRAAMPTSSAMQCIHFSLYVVWALVVLVLVCMLEVKMLQTAGISAWSVLFLILTIGLEFFVCNFSLLASCGVKGSQNQTYSELSNVEMPALRIEPEVVEPPLMTTGGAYSAAYSVAPLDPLPPGVPPPAVPPPVAVVASSQMFVPASQPVPLPPPLGSDPHSFGQEGNIERAILSEFGDALEATFAARTTVFGQHFLIVVPKKGKEQAVSGKLPDIVEFASRKFMEREEMSSASMTHVRIMEFEEYSGMQQSVLVDLSRVAAFSRWSNLAAPAEQTAVASASATLTGQ